MKILIPTCNDYIKHIEALQFSTRFNFLNNFEFIIVGYNAPEFELDPNWTFVSMGEQRGAKYWSNDMRDFLATFPDKHFIYGNDDCAISYLDRFLLVTAIAKAHKYNSIGRFALMAEGKKRPAVPFETYTDSVEINQFTCDADYRLSLGWSIYNKKCFLEFCNEGMSPWDFEISSCGGTNQKLLDKWNFCTFNPNEGAIDAAFFRRKHINRVIDDWHKGYYGHNLEGDLKEEIKKILFR